MTFDRRMFVKGAVLTGAALAVGPIGARSALAMPGDAAGAGAAPDDEAYWARIAAQYDVTREVIQLENANWGMMARPVLDAYQGHLARVNRDTSYYTRRLFWRDAQAIRARVASALAVSEDEIVFTRNATEALKALILQYRGLKPSDAALYADLDYDSMQAAFVSHARACGARPVRIAMPEPATHDAVLAAYEAAFDADPAIKLVLLTHISHRTGLLLPVREIIAMARARGIDAIVDAAHSWGQIDFTLPDLDADFVGLNLHKWIGAPLGVGAAYIRRSRLNAIAYDPANEPDAADRIDSRVHTGTSDFAALLTVNEALDFQQAIGGPAREARLRFLRDRWVSEVRDLPGLEVLTPDDPRMHGGITSFRFAGRTTEQQNRDIAAALLERHRVFTVHRTGVERGACVRITPTLHNSMADCDAAAKALRDLARNLPA